MLKFTEKQKMVEHVTLLQKKESTALIANAKTVNPHGACGVFVQYSIPMKEIAITIGRKSGKIRSQKLQEY